MKWLVLLTLAAVAAVYWTAPPYAGRVHPYVPGVHHRPVPGVIQPGSVAFCQRYGSYVPTLHAQDRWARCMGIER